MFKSLKIKPGRLLQTIHDTAESFGAMYKWGEHHTETGLRRLALGDEDKGMRDWFAKEVVSLGCELKIDELGNMFAIYPGQDMSAIPTGVGSHLDSQPTGGRYDGPLGVLAGLEILRTIKENGYVPNYPIALINWTNEEGARFPAPLLGSSVWSGSTKKEDIYKVKSVTDAPPRTVLGELERIGYKGEVECSHKTNPIACHFEIHIEQAPFLEMAGKKIGVVQGIQSFNWQEIIVRGEAKHTETSPMEGRADALLAAARMVIKGNEIGIKYGGLCSTGYLDVEPHVFNVIPNEVKFSLDTHHYEEDKLRSMLAEIRETFDAIAAKGDGTSKAIPLSVEYIPVFESPPTHFHPECIETVRNAAIEVVGEDMIMDITARAGHDSKETSSIVPTSMVFIPCKDGVSHAPTEYSTPQQVEDGFKVLMNAVLGYDLLRKEKA
ncbi:unnamed protein product [Kuraishia capsulata CBS 1993]|uniref:Peptidase M20 dimerisation domain-containing protein n=1 Tax=Kuraishia capsulata CBS 1993 TaxID=1382522 RepID=W6MH12_9ASCO|nr:uncharacterized protein KUCA_T00001183001 [Kuraishia capsulata CBS 1993]CDK25216.1 unnamed protein product [Kuraishia capsulata CBS 1993]